MTDDATVPPPTSGPQQVLIAVNALGRGAVSVDGHDLSSMVKAVHLSTAVNDLTEVVLEITPAHGALFDGYARVMVGEAPEPGPAAAAFLAAIDPKLLEQAALNRPDLDNDEHGLTKAMLRQLIDWANGVRA
jgi:hypothetical protein